MNEPETTLDVLEFLMNAYPNKAIGEETIQIYLRLLADIPADLLKAAALAHVTQSQFFPTVAELRDAGAALMERALGLPNAYDAWNEVCRAITTHGHIRTPEFTHPLIKKAVDACGGWRTLCMSENQIADRARFFQVYEVYQGRQQEEHRMLPEVAGMISTLAGRLAAGMPQPVLQTGFQVLVHPGTGEVLEVR